MLHRLDSIHLEYPTAPSPAHKPSPSTGGELSLAWLNVPHQRAMSDEPLKYKKRPINPMLCCAQKYRNLIKARKSTSKI